MMKDFIAGYTAGIFTVLIIGYLFVSVGLLPI